MSQMAQKMLALWDWFGSNGWLGSIRALDEMDG